MPCLVGELDDYRSAAAHVTTERLATCSLLFDPRVVWRPPRSPFLEDGEPSRQLQEDLVKAGRRLLAFPFCSDAYLLHLGGATLDRVADTDDAQNRYYTWAQSDRRSHFGLRPDGPELAARFEHVYRAAVPDDDIDTVTRVLADSRT